MSSAEQEQQFVDTLQELERHGIHYDKTTGQDLHFKCDVHPYLPDPLPETIRLFHKIGNIWTFYGPTKTLVIKNLNFSVNK